jgi:hypothetical protein
LPGGPDGASPRRDDVRNARLRDAGILSEEEFERSKQIALA